MKTLLAISLTVFGLAGLAAAQSAAVVVGSIVDQTGAPLAGVRMTIRGVAVRTAATGVAGDFAFSDVPDGDYEISAELSGFERARRAVRVLGGERVTVSLALRVAILEETIVTAAKAGEVRVLEDLVPGLARIFLYYPSRLQPRQLVSTDRYVTPGRKSP